MILPSFDFTFLNSIYHPIEVRYERGKYHLYQVRPGDEAPSKLYISFWFWIQAAKVQQALYHMLKYKGF